MISGSICELVEVILREINKENWEACSKLTLSTSQGGLVAPNLYSIADSKFEPWFMQLAVYHGDDVVGFVMYGLDPDDGKHWIYRLMVDHKYQGNGYGKATMNEVIRMLREVSDCKEIFAGYKPQNLIAGSLLSSFGFRRTGQMLQGEYITRLDMRGCEE